MGKTFLVVSIVLQVTIVSVFAAPKQPQYFNRLINKSPAQLLELWDDASRAEQRAISEKLIENIPASIPILRNKVLSGTQKQKLFACAMIAEVRDINSIPILLQAIDDPDDKVKIRAILSLRGLKANQAADKITLLGFAGELSAGKTQNGQTTIAFPAAARAKPPCAHAWAVKLTTRSTR